MLRYALRRFLLPIPMVPATSMIIFLTLCLGTGDPALNCLRLSNLPPTPEMLASIRAMLGLNQPLYVQYGTWLWGVLHLDFSISFASQRPALNDMLNFLPATLELAGATLVLILFASAPLGIWATRRYDRLLDFTVRSIAFLGMSMPNFWLVFLLVMVFSAYLQWLPAMGYGGRQHIILPAVPIAFMSPTINACLLRTSVLDVADQCHATWVRLCGLSNKQTERRHTLHNTLLPAVTAVGVHIGELIGGTTVIESIFTRPDVGYYAMSAVFNRDYLVTQCFTLMIMVVFMVCSLIVDLLNAALDPRIRRHEGTHT